MSYHLHIPELTILALLHEERKRKGCREAMGCHLCMYELLTCASSGCQLPGNRCLHLAADEISTSKGTCEGALFQ